MIYYAFMALLQMGATTDLSENQFQSMLDICTSKDNSQYSLSAVPFYDSNSVTIDDGKHKFVVEILDETVLMRNANGSRGTKFFRIDRLISQSSDLDLDLRWASINNEPVLFWRETYRHRPARMGIFQVSSIGFRPLCEGMTGSLIVE